MINIDATDKIEGIASVASVIAFTFSGVDGTTVVSSEGLLAATQTQIYLATAATRLLSLTLVNTHSAAVTVNVQKDPADAGTLYNIIPKDLTLGIGYSLCFDGQRCSVMDANGSIVSGASLPVSDTTAIVKGSTDPSKLLRIEVDGFTAETERVLTPQDKNYVIADNADVAAIGGAWVTPTYAAGDFTATGSMTWTVEAGDVADYKYTIINKTMIVSFVISASVVGGTAATQLLVKVPAGKTVVGGSIGFMTLHQGAWVASDCKIDDGETSIKCFVNITGSTNWALGATSLQGFIIFEIS